MKIKMDNNDKEYVIKPDTDFDIDPTWKLPDESKEEKITKAANRLNLPKEIVEPLIDLQEKKEEQMFKGLISVRIID